MRDLMRQALGVFVAPAGSESGSVAERARPGSAAANDAAFEGAASAPASASAPAPAPVSVSAPALAAFATGPMAALAEPAPTAARTPAPAPGPGAPATAATTTAAPGPARAAVLADAPSAPPLAAALASELRVRARHPTALVCVWGPDAHPPPRGAAPAAPARALVTRLAAQGHDATARGHLAWIALPAAPEAAADALVRVSARVEAPVVLALAGARPAALDPLLADLDLVLVSPPAGMSSAAVELALAELARERASVVVRRPLPRGSSRWLALAGRSRLRGHHAALEAALGGGA